MDLNPRERTVLQAALASKDNLVSAMTKRGGIACANGQAAADLMRGLEGKRALAYRATTRTETETRVIYQLAPAGREAISG